MFCATLRGSPTRAILGFSAHAMAKTKQQQIKDLRDEALALVRSEDHRKALERFAQLERLDPDEADWPRRAADCHRARGDVPAQIAALGRAAELYGRTGALPKAIALCKLILGLDPRHTETQARLSALQGGPAPARGSVLAPGRPPLPLPPVKQTEPPRGRPELAQALRQARATQAKAPPPAPVRSPKPAQPRAPEPIAPPFVLPVAAGRPSVPSHPAAVPILEEGSLSDAVPGSKRIPGPRGVPSGMFRIDVGDVRAPKLAESPQATALKTLPVTPLFSELGPSSLERLIARARLVHLEPGAVAYRQGDAADALYVIASGSVVLVAEGETRVETTRLGDGEFFGEAALLGSEPRPSTAEILEPTDLLAVDSQAIRELIADEPRVLTTVLRFLRERLVESSMLTNPLFTILSRSERRRLAERFDFVEIERDSLAIWQGVLSPGLFILLSGTAEVIADDEGEERRLAVLQAGSVFGEMSLLRSEAAIGDVRCITTSYALMLPRADFAAVVAEYPAVLEFVELLAATRRGQNELRG